MDACILLVCSSLFNLILLLLCFRLNCWLFRRIKFWFVIVLRLKSCIVLSKFKSFELTCLIIWGFGFRLFFSNFCFKYWSWKYSLDMRKEFEESNSECAASRFTSDEDCGLGFSFHRWVVPFFFSIEMRSSILLLLEDKSISFTSRFNSRFATRVVVDESFIPFVPLWTARMWRWACDLFLNDFEQAGQV